MWRVVTLRISLKFSSISGLWLVIKQIMIKWWYVSNLTLHGGTSEPHLFFCKNKRSFQIFVDFKNFLIFWKTWVFFLKFIAQRKTQTIKKSLLTYSEDECSIMHSKKSRVDSTRSVVGFVCRRCVSIRSTRKRVESTRMRVFTVCYEIESYISTRSIQKTSHFSSCTGDEKCQKPIIRARSSLLIIFSK
jgi:hypothetical protein